MNKINNSHILYCKEAVYNTFFKHKKSYVSTTTEMPEIYNLDSIAHEKDKIILIDFEQDAELLKQGFVHNGYQKIKLDNLKHIYVQKYLLKHPDGNSTEFTNLLEIRDENQKYSHFLCNTIVEFYYINYQSFENVSNQLKLIYGIDISEKRVCDLYYKTIDSFILKKVEDLNEQIRSGKIKLGQVANYDEEFMYYKHQPVVRLTIIDYKTKIILRDIIIPRKEFDRNYIKSFIEEALSGLNYHTVVTDGDKRYKKILKELGLNQQRCIFHSMQNLMSKLNPVHNRLKRKIKSINSKISDKNVNLTDLENKYKGCVGRPKETDNKRKNDIKQMKKLRREISDLKAERRKHKKHIKEDKKYIKKISKLLKSKKYERGIELFNELWEIKDTLSKEIASHLKNLKEYLHEALMHTLVKGVPRTNNLIESFYKRTIPRKFKNIFMTYDGLVKRMLLSDLRWVENALRQNMKDNINLN